MKKLSSMIIVMLLLQSCIYKTREATPKEVQKCVNADYEYHKNPKNDNEFRQNFSIENKCSTTSFNDRHPIVSGGLLILGMPIIIPVAIVGFIWFFTTCGAHCMSQ